MSLAQKQCVPCQGGVPPLTQSEAEELREQVPEWSLSDDAKKIRRTFKFGNFVAALDFVNGVGRIAEEEGHHPDITFGWGYAAITFFTHKIDGLHENDFIMAAKTDALAAQD